MVLWSSTVSSCLLNMFISDRGHIKISIHNNGFISFSCKEEKFIYFSFVNFCLPYFVVRGIHSKNRYVFLAIWPLISCNAPFYLKTFLALKSALSEINTAIPTFFWSVLSWYLFLHPFNFNLYVSLYLKRVSCQWQRVGLGLVFDSFLLASLWLQRTLLLFPSVPFRKFWSWTLTLQHLPWD